MSFDDARDAEMFTRLAAKVDSDPDPLAKQLLDLHTLKVRSWGQCPGCDMEGYEAEEPEWPCRTVGLLLARYGMA